LKPSCDGRVKSNMEVCNLIIVVLSATYGWHARRFAVWWITTCTNCQVIYL